MPLTVEKTLLAYAKPDDPDKRWIGINQNASNRYVEHFLREGAFAAITGPVRTVRREVPLGDSRLDFLVNDDLYLEVKTPLVQMQTDIPPYVPRLPEAPFSSTERSLRHLRELAASLADHERAAISTTSATASGSPYPAPPARGKCSPRWTPAGKPAWSSGRPTSE